MTFPHAWLSPETSVAIATSSFVGAVICFARAAWYGLVGVPAITGVSYPQFAETRERQEKKIAAQSTEIAELQARNAELASLVAAQKLRLQEVVPILAAMERDAPRHLSATEREIIRGRLQGVARAWQYRHGIPGIAIYYAPGSDCAPYAQEFHDLLVSLEFHVFLSVLRPEYVANRDTDYYRSGIFVLDVPMTLHGSQPTFGTALHRAMAEAGIPATLLDREGRGCILIIGAKADT
ncbi:MAG: hypothetical protein QOK37_78 [Thermoanaerobaculia bacterium]|nr:hypothetical protein [Thermoanaerobaculia bacterium]